MGPIVKDQEIQEEIPSRQKPEITHCKTLLRQSVKVTTCIIFITVKL